MKRSNDFQLILPTIVKYHLCRTSRDNLIEMSLTFLSHKIKTKADGNHKNTSYFESTAEFQTSITLPTLHSHTIFICILFKKIKSYSTPLIFLYFTSEVKYHFHFCVKIQQHLIKLRANFHSGTYMILKVLDIIEKC